MQITYYALGMLFTYNDLDSFLLDFGQINSVIWIFNQGSTASRSYYLIFIRSNRYFSF